MVLPLRSLGDWPVLAVVSLAAADWREVPCCAYADEAGVVRTFRADKDRDPCGALLDFLLRPNGLPVVFAHATLAHDLRELLAVADDRGYGWQAMGSEGPVPVASVATADREVVLVDSARLLPEDPALPATRRAWYAGDVKEEWALRPDAVAAECARDARQTLDAMVALRTALLSRGVKGGGVTLAGLATAWIRHSAPLKWWRMYSVHRGIFSVLPELAGYEEGARAADHGGLGLCDADGTVPGGTHGYDLRSAYPWAMCQLLPAYPKDMKGSTDDPAEMARRFARPGFSLCEVECPEGLSLPVLPRKGQADLEFPREPFAATFAHCELELALEAGYAVRVLRTDRWVCAPWLAPFARTFYALREEASARGDKVGEYACKALLNSASGRLTEREEKERIVSGLYYRHEAVKSAKRSATYPHFEDLLGGRVHAASWASRGGLVHRGAGATVRALIRCRTLRMLRAIEQRGGRIDYAHCDAVYCDLPPAVLGKLVLAKPGLGDWRHQGAYREAEFRGLHCYRLTAEDGAETFRVRGARCRSRSDWERYLDIRQGLSREGYRGLREDLHRGRVAPSPTAGRVRHRG